MTNGAEPRSDAPTAINLRKEKQTVKKYTKASMEVVEIKNTDIVTDSGEGEEGGGHGATGNQDAGSGPIPGLPRPC